MLEEGGVDEGFPLLIYFYHFLWQVCDLEAIVQQRKGVVGYQNHLAHELWEMAGYFGLEVGDALALGHGLNNVLLVGRQDLDQLFLFMGN